MSETNSPIRRIYSVSEINSETKNLLEQRFISVFVQGEVSNFSAPRSGHWYFTIKDATAQIRVVMFKNANIRAKQPSPGDEIVVGGQISFYEGRGEVQIIARQIKPAGLGDLQAQFELLKKKLLEEGLFEKSAKLPIPYLPNKVAVVTSPSGAVIKDIIQVSGRRAPSMDILVLPVSVQGEAAEAEICEAIRVCQNREGIDIIILARGGGSLEDFTAFNSESVAREIFGSRIPIISGVGHETDVSIADFVADRRAATPSEAAELVSAGYVELKQRLNQISITLDSQGIQVLRTRQHAVDKLTLRLVNPVSKLREISQRIDQFELQLNSFLQTALALRQSKLDLLKTKFEPQLLRGKIAYSHERLGQQKRRMQLACKAKLGRSKDQLTRKIQVLEALSPLRTLARGYAVVLDSNNTVVSSVTNTQVGAELSIKLDDGLLESTVTDVTRQAD